MVSRRSVTLELGGLGAATLVFLATFTVRPAYVDFILAGAAAVLILIARPRSRRLWEAAFTPTEDRRARYLSSGIAVGAFTALALATLAGAAVVAARQPGAATLGARFGNPHILLAAPVYFLWALLQQYIFQHYLLGRLVHVVPVALAIAITALVFASVHFPRWPVMGLTAVAGVVWALAYYRFRVLIPLAVSHALLGAALHYWVFAHDLIETWLG